MLNKSDLTGLPPGVERDACGNIAAVRVSALTGEGVAELRAALAERFTPAPIAAPTDHIAPARPG